MYFDILCTKKVLQTTRLLKKISILKSFHIFKRKERLMLRISIYYYKKIPVAKNFKFLSTPSRSFFLSYRALTLLVRRTGSSLYLLSTNKGVITHDIALNHKIGGKVIMLLTI